MCSFVEKALIPQIKKFEGSLQEWNKFYSLISVNHINYSELQLFVDTLPSQIKSVTPEKQISIKKK